MANHLFGFHEIGNTLFGFDTDPITLSLSDSFAATALVDVDRGSQLDQLLSDSIHIRDRIKLQLIRPGPWTS